MNIATNSSLESFHPHIATWFREQVGIPTPVQEEGWPVILRGENALLTAPTGTGKTLAAFLAAINRFYLKYLAGESQGGLRVLYLSPLKSLTNDMYHNLQRPIQGLGLTSVLKVAVRNSDTSPKDRRTTLRHPPHILLTTPESLFVLLTAKNGRTMLQNVETVIVDEVHALLDSKRGTHLALSLERLEALVGKPLQRVGLSATVNPVETAAAFLVGFSQEEPRPVQIIAPPTVKRAQVQVTSPVEDMRVLPEGTIWPEICKTIYNLAKEVRTTLVFLNHRAPCEKVAHGINSLYGGAFALTHHGCVSKEQRLEAERLLKAGELRCLCATSSMELGIDVGEVDLVLQVAAPPSVASGLQRMGRAGHTPQSVSVMHLLPRTVADSLACGFIAESVAAGAMEEAVIPQNCLDVLAQHCVSMAAVEEWQVADILQLARQAYPYRQLNLPELETVLAMLYGDYEHREEKPVYPRLNYDRIQGLVSAAPSSRMLALLSGGTIPDRGYYGVVLEDGTRLGELDEVFVFESRLGDRFMLGAFAWQIQRVDRDRVVVKPVSTAGARSPFWQGDWHGRKYSFGKRIGAVMGRLEGIEKSRELEKALSQELMLDEAAAANVARLLIAQREANGCLPTDKRIVVEHFRDAQGNASAVIYMSYGGRVNLGLLMLLEHTLAGEGETVQFMQNEEGLLLHSLDNRRLPAGLLQRLPEQGVPELLRRLLPHNPLFAMVFRYNASRALMMGMRQRGRVPLWVQRLRSDEALQRALSYPDHPLLVETMQDCLENYLDLAGITEVIAALKSGQIAVREVYHEQPSPMAIEYQRMFEGEYMYADPKPEKTVTRTGALVEVLPSLAAAPEAEDLLQVAALPLPEDSMEMHRYLMISGDLRLQDIDNRVL
ncbi:MAG: DEAD/DEAH box helicase, partial [Symbiobacteriaceae bacterium]|nr:DEAD/DEAH box helicase [Symbiobacteriaceae bacterium]